MVQRYDAGDFILSPMRLQFHGSSPRIGGMGTRKSSTPAAAIVHWRNRLLMSNTGNVDTHAFQHSAGQSFQINFLDPAPTSQPLIWPSRVTHRNHEGG